jgi:hypothetical protein
MQHRNSLPHPPKPTTNPARAANATKTDSKNLPQKCTQNSKQFAKKKNKTHQSETHAHTLGKGFRAAFGNPILQQEFASKTCKNDGVCAF